jgi:hypothetical protein
MPSSPTDVILCLCGCGQVIPAGAHPTRARPRWRKGHALRAREWRRAQMRYMDPDPADPTLRYTPPVPDTATFFAYALLADVWSHHTYHRFATACIASPSGGSQCDMDADWITSTAADSICHFETVCSVLGMDADLVRTRW